MGYHVVCLYTYNYIYIYIDIITYVHLYIHIARVSNSPEILGPALKKEMPLPFYPQNVPFLIFESMAQLMDIIEVLV